MSLEKMVFSTQGHMNLRTLPFQDTFQVCFQFQDTFQVSGLSLGLWAGLSPGWQDSSYGSLAKTQKSRLRRRHQPTGRFHSVGDASANELWPVVAFSWLLFPFRFVDRCIEQRTSGWYIPSRDNISVQYISRNKLLRESKCSTIKKICLAIKWVFLTLWPCLLGHFLLCVLIIPFYIGYTA